jgi:hypothetical protein
MRRHLIGTGPFKFAEFERNDRMEANPSGDHISAAFGC